MSIPYNPSAAAMSPDPSLGNDHTRRIVMNPPDSFLQSAAAQAAIAAGQATPPQSNGPIAFANGGQAVLMPVGSKSGESSGSDRGSGVMPASSAMGMGVNTPDQKGLDPNVMQSIQQQIASPIASPTAASAVTPNSPSSPATTPATPATIASPLAVSARPSNAVSTSVDPSASSPASASALASPILAADPSASASPSASVDAASGSHNFIHSPAFILLMVFSALILFGVIATALSWLLRWRGKDGSRSLFGAGCCGVGGRRSTRDLESDDLSDIVRNFENRRGSYGTESTNSYTDDAMEKRSSLLAEEMGRAPFLHSGMGLGVGDGMVDVDLGDEGLPRMPAATMPSDDGMVMMGMGMGSPRAEDQFGTGRLEVRNRAQSDFGDEAVGAYGDRSRTVPAPRSWANERGLSNLGAGWMRNKSSNSLPSAIGSLPSPFTNRSNNGSTDNLSRSSGSTAVSRTQSVKSVNKWDRSDSNETDMSLGEHEVEEAPQSSTWATNLRSSLLAAISGPKTAPLPDADKFTRPILPVYLSRSSTHRSALSRSSTGRTPGISSNTFGRAGGGLVIREEDEGDGCSLASSARLDIEAALLGAEGVSRASSSASDAIAPRGRGVAPLDIRKSGGSGERWKRFARSSKAGSVQGRDEVDSLV